MKNFIDLSDKTAIVTGSSSGIGLSTALTLAQAGANVVLAARRIERLEELSKEIEKSGQKALSVQTDVTKKDDLQKLVSETLKRFGKIDILVNNAGVLEYKNFLEIDDAHRQKIMGTNFKGYLWLSQTVAKEMIKKKYGKVINVASIAGIFAFPQITMYNISKAAVIMLTKSMATELGEFNINVNAICPGVIETEMTGDLLKDPKTAQSFLEKIPLKRTGQPEDIAEVALFLASDLSSYITGQTVTVDGGWTSHL